MRTIRNLFIATVFLTSITTLSEHAKATDCSQPSYVYKTILVWEVVRIPVVKTAVKYDCDGYPHADTVISYRTQRVAIEKRIRVAR